MNSTQATDDRTLDRQLRDMNEALLISSLRQHELAEQAEQAEAAASESEQRYRNLFNSMDEGYCIIEMIFDKREKPVDYRFLEVNRAFDRQSGMHDVTGQRMLEFVADIPEPWLANYGQVALTGVPIRFANEYSSLGRWFEVYAFRVGEPHTRTVAVLFTDITERNRAEAAVRESEEQYRTLFDLGPVAIYSCDAAGVIQTFNRRAAELWGREPARGDTDERFCGSFRMLRPDGTFMPHEQCPMAEVLSGEIAEMRDAEVLIERPDGSRITVLVNIRPLKNDQGEVRGAINCFSDITERSLLERKTKEQAQSLADLHRRKDEFLAMLSHELRNPLAPIQNAVHLLRLQQDRTPIQVEAHGMIDRQVGQLARLVDDLLEVSRITTGRVHLQEERLDLRGIVARAIDANQPQAGQKGQSVAKSLPNAPIWVYGDPMRLEQVVVNLLNNASKYTDRGGHIWVELKVEGVEAILRVRDTGVGIAPELLPRIFDLFTQADKSLDRSQGGLGIGLALVQSLVTMHHGRVEAKSSPGQGSEFIVTLPVLLSPDVTVVQTVELEKSSGQSLKVLVVDDSVDAAKGLAMLLRAYRHDARLAHDGAGAMQVALEYVPDVVLLDIGLPIVNGYEVAKWIRQEPALKNVVLVALTGYGQESDRKRTQEAGFDHHLVKPADFAKLESILAAVAEKKARE